MTNRVDTRLITLLASSDIDKVTTSYMAIAKHYVDNCKDKTRYKVEMNSYLYKLNELVIIDIELVKSMVVEFIEFHNYAGSLHMVGRNYQSFTDSVGVDYCFSNRYIATVDNNITTYNETLNVLKQFVKPKVRETD